MIKLDKIVLHGFKSFNRKTSIKLFDGFNAVIGPNGSGKTALLDAICFVLGRSSRTLRADRADQIIFNGGFGKKPSDFATVSLHIDNPDEIIPNVGKKFVISRRVNKRGNSTYRLNEKVVNRARILEVLRYGRIDPYGHNIIQQGEVIKIIDMKPKERREIIDEVSGIKEYNEKKEKALKELEKAQNKLNDSNLIMEEKKNQLEKLKREKDLALKHNELEKNLEKLKATLAFSRVRAVEGEMENVTRNLELKEREFESLQNKVSSFDTDLPKKEKIIKEIDKEILKRSVNVELRKEIEEITSEILIKDGQINANSREVERIDEMLSKLTQMRDTKSDAVKSVLNRQGVFGTISTLSKIPTEYSIAIEVAIGPHLNDVVVDAEQNAINHVTYLKSENLGRVRFLPMNRLHSFIHSSRSIDASKKDGIIDFAINIVNFDNKYKIAFENVFRDTLVAENMDTARKIRGVRVVTLEGELFEASGAIIGGTFRKRRTVNMDVLKQYESDKMSLEKDTQKLRLEIGKLNKDLDDKRNLEKKESSSVVHLQKEKETLEEEIEKNTSKRHGTYERKHSLDDEIQTLKVRKARLEGEYDNLMIDYEPYKDREGLQKEDPEKISRDLRKVGVQLDNIGLVNLKAIDEFDGFNEEYDNFKEKLVSLEEERQSIISMIEHIDEKRKKIFLETLNIISKEFSTVFLDVTDGAAELKLEDPEDIESGLIIKAQPYGKKLLNIDSLSGGEKTITALTFLFAIQRYRPAPFYILDEIDAALDKPNSELVGKLIKKYSHNAQFLLISHNDATVRHASHVYGVSMQKGTSQILGIDLKNNVNT